MALPVKTAITQIATGNNLTHTFGNNPHDNLETNIDDILTYLDTYPFDHIGVNEAGITGLTFAYHDGTIRYNNTIITVTGSTLAMTANESNYVEVDNAGTVSSNITSFTVGQIPLWIVATDGSDILSWADARNWNKFVTEYATDLTIGGNLTVDGGLIGNNGTGGLRMNALTGTTYLANNSGNGQVIVRDGAGGTGNQIILDGNAGSIMIAGSVAWHSGNDGSGSGLDADLLDGLNSVQILRTDISTATTGTITINRALDADLLIGKDYSGTNKLTLKTDSGSGNDFVFLANVSTVDQTSSLLRFDSATPDWEIGTDTIWHAGNDGTGSGLDADLFRGQEGSYYSGVKINAADTTQGNLDTKLISNTIEFTTTGAGPYTYTAKLIGPTFISPVTITTGTGGAWITYGLTSWVPAGTRFILVEVEMNHSYKIDGDQWYTYARKDSGSNSLTIGRIYGNFDNNKFVNQWRLANWNINQCFLPITTGRDVDIKVNHGNNRNVSVKLIGYW